MYLNFWAKNKKKVNFLIFYRNSISVIFFLNFCAKIVVIWMHNALYSRFMILFYDILHVWENSEMMDLINFINRKKGKFGVWEEKCRVKKLTGTPPWCLLRDLWHHFSKLSHFPKVKLSTPFLSPGIEIFFCWKRWWCLICSLELWNHSWWTRKKSW